jgi:hypothetical protein
MRWHRYDFFLLISTLILLAWKRQSLYLLITYLLWRVYTGPVFSVPIRI